MNEVNKTLYIPLYGKAQVSKKRIIINDSKAEEIWQKEHFELKGKAKSKWLAYFMSMRARVFDDWTEKMLKGNSDILVLHIGCGLDSRIIRIGNVLNNWYDIDFPDVIAERKKYYSENNKYHMLCADVSKQEWIASLPDSKQAVVILEGISMYLKNEETEKLFLALQSKFEKVYLLMDIYTTFAAKATKYKNPVNDVGVTKVYGVADYDIFIKNKNIRFVKEHSMTPEYLVNELTGFEKSFFKIMFAGKATKKIYRLFEYEINKN